VLGKHELTGGLRVNEKTAGKPPEEALTDCKQKVDELTEENEQLRNSAETFGELAERLNAEHRKAKGMPPNTGIISGEKSQRNRRLRS
jgi:hypothetical protein